MGVMGSNVGNLSLPPGFQALSMPGQISSPTADMAQLMTASQAGPVARDRAISTIGGRYGGMQQFASAYGQETGQDPRAVAARLGQHFSGQGSDLGLEKPDSIQPPAPIPMPHYAGPPQMPGDQQQQGGGANLSPAPANPQAPQDSSNPIGMMGLAYGMNRGRAGALAEPGDGGMVSTITDPITGAAPGAADVSQIADPLSGELPAGVGADWGLDFGIGGLGADAGAEAGGGLLSGLGLEGLFGGAGAAAGGAELAGLGTAAAESAPEWLPALAMAFAKKGGSVRDGTIKRFEEGGNVDDTGIINWEGLRALQRLMGSEGSQPLPDDEQIKERIFRPPVPTMPHATAAEPAAAAAPPEAPLPSSVLDAFRAPDQASLRPSAPSSASVSMAPPGEMPSLPAPRAAPPAAPPSRRRPAPSQPDHEAELTRALNTEPAAGPPAAPTEATQAATLPLPSQALASPPETGGLSGLMAAQGFRPGGGSPVTGMMESGDDDQGGFRWGDKNMQLLMMGLGILGQPRHWGDGPLAGISRGALQGAQMGMQGQRMQQQDLLHRDQLEANREYRRDRVDDRRERTAEAERHNKAAEAALAAGQQDRREARTATQETERNRLLESARQHDEVARHHRVLEARMQAQVDAPAKGEQARVAAQLDLYKKAREGDPDAQALVGQQTTAKAPSQEGLQDKAVKDAQNDVRWLTAKNAAERQKIIDEYKGFHGQQQQGGAAPADPVGLR